MADEKVRIRKNIRSKVELWSTTFEISISEFVHEAITHYIRFLDGKPTGSNVVQLPIPEPSSEVEQEENDSDYDGGFVL